MDVQIKCLILVLFGTPGVLCRDDYDVGGMVAASAVGFLFFIAAIIMAAFICFWPDYYHRQQTLRGKVRVPRIRKKWRWWSTKRSTSHKTEKTNVIPMYDINGVQRESRNSTLQGHARAATWMEKIPYETHETKSKTINLGQEDEPVIVAEVMPDGITENIERTHTYVYSDVSKSRQDNHTQYVRTEENGPRYTVKEDNVIRYTTSEPAHTQYTNTTTDSLAPIHIKLETRGFDEGSPDQFRANQLRATTPARVHSGQSEDIIITPVIPLSMSNQNYQGPPLTYQYQPTEYQIRQGENQRRQPTVEDEAVIQFGDGELLNY